MFFFSISIKCGIKSNQVFNITCINHTKIPYLLILCLNCNHKYKLLFYVKQIHLPQFPRRNENQERKKCLNSQLIYNIKKHINLAFKYIEHPICKQYKGKAKGKKRQYEKRMYHFCGLCTGDHAFVSSIRDKFSRKIYSTSTRPSICIHTHAHTHITYLFPFHNMPNFYL